MPLIPLLLRFWWAIPIAILTATTAFYKHEAQSNHDQLISFQSAVSAVAEQATIRNREIIAKQQKVSSESAKSYETRLALINAEYSRLRDQKANGGSRPMPAVPDTARPVDDTARDNRLAEVLRAAEVETAKLEALQGWIRNIPR